MDDYREQLDETVLDYLRQIEQGGSRMTQLIDDLLAYGRLRRILLDLRPGRVYAVGERINRVAGEKPPMTYWVLLGVRLHV